MKHLRLNSLLLFLGLLISSYVSAQPFDFKPFKHYNERMAEFRRQAPITSMDIVMLGNSLIENGGDWNKLLETSHIRNRGISGDVTMGIYRRLDTILSGKPRAIFLLVGTNDVSHQLTPKQVFERCVAVIEKIRTDAPAVRLYVQSLLPFNDIYGRWKLLEGKLDDIPEINRLLSAYCEEHGITFINLFPKFVRHGTNELRRELTSDGLHLTPIGYKIWAFELRKYIQELDMLLMLDTFKLEL